MPIYPLDGGKIISSLLVYNNFLDINNVFKYIGNILFFLLISFDLILNIKNIILEKNKIILSNEECFFLISLHKFIEEMYIIGYTKNEYKTIIEEYKTYIQTNEYLEYFYFNLINDNRYIINNEYTNYSKNLINNITN